MRPQKARTPAKVNSLIGKRFEILAWRNARMAASYECVWRLRWETTLRCGFLENGWREPVRMESEPVEPDTSVPAEVLSFQVNGTGIKLQLSKIFCKEFLFPHPFTLFPPPSLGKIIKKGK